MDGFESLISLAGWLQGAVLRQPKACVADGLVLLALLQRGGLVNKGPSQLSQAFPCPKQTACHYNVLIKLKGSPLLYWGFEKFLETLPLALLQLPPST